MRTLVLSSAFPPHIYGGGEVAAYNLTRLLVRRGHDVSVATMLERDAQPCWGERMPEGYKLYRLPLPRTHTYYGRATAKSAHKLVWHAQDYADARNRTAIQRVLAEVDPEHVDIHNVAGIGYNVLPLLQGCSTAYFLHDLGLACFSGSMYRAGGNCPHPCVSCHLTSALRQHFLAAVPRLGFVSPSQANIDRLATHVAAVRKRPTAVIRNVPDELPRLPAHRPSAVPRLLYAGRLEAIKGISFLLDVLASLAPTHPLHLTVLGTGRLEAELRARYGECSWVMTLPPRGYPI